MTITIDIIQFIQDSLNRILKQVHLSENYRFRLFSPSEIPSSIKKLGKEIVPADFFNGVKAKIIVFKAKHPSEVKNDDVIKIAQFVKTTFFLTEDSPFSINDVYQVNELTNGKNRSKDDDNTSNDDNLLKNIYFFVKIELKN